MWRPFLSDTLLRFSYLLAATMLVVLVIMITFTPIMRDPPWLDLPSSRAGRLLPYTKARVVTLRKDGALFLDVDAVTTADLPRKLTSPPPELLLRVDRMTSMRDVRALFVALREAGVPRVTIVAEREKFVNQHWH